MSSLSLTLFRDSGVSERNLWRAAGFTAALILAFGGVAWVEQHVLDLPRAVRLVGNAAEAATRSFTIPHVIIGFLFMLTAARNQNAPRRFLIGGLLLGGAVLSLGYGQVLGWGARRLAELLLYSYFLIHELRDEASFYCLLGDAPKTAATDKRFRAFIQGLIGVVLTFVALALWVSYTTRPHPDLLIPGLSPAQMQLGAGMTAAGCVAAGWSLVRWYGRGSGLTVSAVLREHRRLFRLFASVLLVTVVGALLTGRLFCVVLLHVAVWYVFTCGRLRQRPASLPTARGIWGWMRGTLAGFQALHLGLAAGLILVGALALHGFAPAGHVWWLLAPESLPYWTIMHITVSFVPR